MSSPTASRRARSLLARRPAAAALRRRVSARPRRSLRSGVGSLGLALGALVLTVMLVTTGALGFAGVVTVAGITALSSDLPDPSALASLTFEQPTVVYDRTGKIELGRFQRTERRVVSFPDVPKLVIDATTTAEDRSFWQNEGFDVTAIVSAAVDTLNGNGRGASTITQQLVRARLLPEDATAPGSDVYLRKAKEIIQSARLTQTYPGETGKELVITAYLNQIYYGHDAYGIAAAADAYFGVRDLAQLTPAQAALLAGLPQSPSTLDPYRYAQEDASGKLVVPPTAPPVVRRDWILRNLGQGRWTHLTQDELNAALAEPVVLRGDRPIILRAPHFTWQVRRQLEAILGSADKVETGGYRVITTLDWQAQTLAERTVAAGVIAPNLPRKKGDALLRDLKVPAADRGWIDGLRGKDLHNAALVALDYRTGDVRAYVGSGGYYRDSLASREFNPKFDAAGVGTRQPGSAFKPILYATAFERKILTPGSLLLDITTRFAPRAGWVPKDADRLDRGPVLVRGALQMSLNVPAIRALQRVGNEAVADQAEKMGLSFAGGRRAFLQANLAGAIGTVEVRPLDLVSAFGTLANGGVHEPARMILQVTDPSGRVVYQAPNAGTQALSANSAYLVTDILAGNTDPRQNKVWADVLELRNGPKGQHRPAAVKTGTSNDARDLATYGYLPAPKAKDEPAWAVGVWMGNSDHSMPRTREPATSLTAAAPLWKSFVRQLTNGQPVTGFAKPNGVVSATIDAWTGGRPGPWTRSTTTELFRAGTQPGAPNPVDPPGLLYSVACGQWQVNPLKAERGPLAWDPDIQNWMSRARGGPGVTGPLGTKTAYFWGRTGWGGRIAGPCYVPPPPPVQPIQVPQRVPVRHGPTPNPPRTRPSPTPPAATPAATPAPTPAATPKPTPKPKPPKPPKPPGGTGSIIDLRLVA